ncbi:AraC family transcriptional regulator [Algoriphagus sp. AK58]|uniref:helix-turn-helix domain-containing protein n=1 Tax=Algoriphagus sp. AK58 TaxID=1406877 RepID=UPI001650CA9A|nr:AraC family transcriptional regulator [Algoriphagus sp. AK58]MBC6367993.1 AraC family transcriptional regulator [Algoriphagus sp. AK58]
MENAELLIKNMVCPRCVEAVRASFDDLGITPISVELGKVILQNELTEVQKAKLEKSLFSKGFEILEDAKSALISKIKTLIIDRIHHQQEIPNLNISDFLTQQIPHDYAYLSRLFSSVESVTIERFYTRQKIEKVKELLYYGEMTLSEIAHLMGYSSVAYLSSQFKKETGMTPSEFKSSGKPNRKSLDQI